MLTGSILEPQHEIDGGVISPGTTNVEFDVKMFASKSACKYGSTTKTPSAHFNAEIDVLEILATDATIW